MSLRWTIIFVLLLLSIQYTVAKSYTIDYNNPLTCSNRLCLDSFYCLIDGSNCALGGGGGGGNFSLNVSGDTGTGEILNNEIFSIVGINGLSTSMSGNILTITKDNQTVGEAVGDSLGNHTAERDLNMTNNSITELYSINPNTGQTVIINPFATADILNDEFDLLVGNMSSGAMRIGNTDISSGGTMSVGGASFDGTLLFLLNGTVPSVFEFVLGRIGETIRLAIPKPQADFATQMVRSVMIGGDDADAFNDNIINCTAQGYNNLSRGDIYVIDCDTDSPPADGLISSGADAGVADTLLIGNELLVWNDAHIRMLLEAGEIRSNNWSNFTGTSSQITDLNVTETPRVNAITDENCTGTDKAIGFQTNGTIVCQADTVGADSLGNHTAATNLNMTSHNITEIQGLYFHGNSAIVNGTKDISSTNIVGADDAWVFFNGHGLIGGSIGFSFIEADKILRTFQTGLPEKGSYMRNSQIIGEQFGTNATQVSDCPFNFDQWGVLQRIGCNSSQLGSAVAIQAQLQVGDILVATGGNKTTNALRIDGDVDIFGGGFDVDISNASLHIRTPRQELIGIVQGGIFTPLNENFEDGNIFPFVKIAQVGIDIRNWLTVSDTECFDDECARAQGGNGNAQRIMETNVSTINGDNCSLSFNYTTNLFVAGNLFNVTLNNNTGSGETEFFSTSTDVAAAFVNTSISSNFLNVSQLTVRYRVNGGASTEAWVDNTLLACNASISTEENVTRQDATIKWGDGTCTTDYNGSDNSLAVGKGCSGVTFPGNITVTDTIIGNVTVADFWDEFDRPEDINNTFLFLDNSNQGSWTPSTTKVLNLNSDQVDGVGVGTSGSALCDISDSCTITGLWEYDEDVLVLDNIVWGFGFGNDAGAEWDTDPQGNHLQINTKVGTISGSGFITIVESGDTGVNNRKPNAVTNDPTLRIYSSDENEASDYLEFVHDQDNPHINFGNGVLTVNGSAGINITVDGVATIRVGDRIILVNSTEIRMEYNSTIYMSQNKDETRIQHNDVFQVLNNTGFIIQG